MKLSHLKELHPFMGKNWTLIILSSLFIALFMVVFEPFGLNTLKNEHKSLILVGYGVVTFLVLTTNLVVAPFILGDTFKESTWTLWKEILWFSMILVMLGIANFAYSSKFLSFTPTVEAFFAYQFYTFTIGIFPTTVASILFKNRMLAQNLSNAIELNSQLTAAKHSHPIKPDATISIYSESKKEHVNLKLASLLYIESQGNYIHIYYFNDSEVTSSVLRTTLKLIENSLSEFPQMIRCHRGFLVNTLNIAYLKGNAQGYKLSFNGTEKEIPLARGYAKDFQDYIRSND